MKHIIILIILVLTSSTILRAQNSKSFLGISYRPSETSYRPLVDGVDTVGFFTGSESNPFENTYLFISLKSDKFIESHPGLDLRLASSDLSKEVYSFWNIPPLNRASSHFEQEKIRFKSRQFYKGEKKITMQEFYELIPHSEKQEFMRVEKLGSLRMLERSQNKSVFMFSLFSFSGMVLGVGLGLDTPNGLAGDGGLQHFGKMFLSGSLGGVLLGVLTSGGVQSSTKKNKAEADKVMNEIVNRYNKSISAQ
jgi:hypothetical protein